MACPIRSLSPTWEKCQSQNLAAELRLALSSSPGERDWRELLEMPLTSIRRALAPTAAGDVPWHLLPLIVCDSICGDTAPAMPAAAAMQFMLAAGDMLDDVEDADSADSLAAKYGPALAVNAASALIILAEGAINQASAVSVAHIAAEACHIFNTYYARACYGQHLELSTPPGGSVTEEEYLKMISLKSASQIECACHLGALLGGAGETLIEDYRAFGNNLGMAAQLANDALGIASGKDITRRKITLPVIFALKHSAAEIRTGLEAVYLGRSREEVDTEQVRAWLAQCGGIYYAAVQQELFTKKARETLAGIAARGISTDRFGIFFESEIGPA